MLVDLTYKLEVCVTNLEDAVQAASHGASRIEICTRLETEGMTPDIELVISICRSVKIPVRVMVRETEEGYAADDEILQQMIDRIHELKKLPIEGFVIGVLDKKSIDHSSMSMLLEAASPMPVTFHKAIDLIDHTESEIMWLNQFEQIDTLLSSGGAVKAIAGILRLKEMKELFKGDVMAAGKILPEDLSYLHAQLGLRWYHGRNIVG